MRERLIEWLMLPFFFIMIFGIPLLLTYLLGSTFGALSPERKMEFQLLLLLGAVWWILKSYFDVVMNKLKQLEGDISRLETLMLTSSRLNSND